MLQQQALDEIISMVVQFKDKQRDMKQVRPP